MLKSLHLKNFTVFPDAKLEFGKHLNIVIGENGLGKSHLLKVLYSALAVSAQRGIKQPDEKPSKEVLVPAITDKLMAVFRPDELGRLVNRKQGNKSCHIDWRMEGGERDMSLTFSRQSKSVKVTTTPSKWLEMSPAFLPTRELLTLLPEFISLYDNNYTRFDETWRDTCGILQGYLARGAREKKTKILLEPLEQAMGGTVSVDKAGRFYLELKSGSMEMHLVAEGLRKLAMLARLIATGALLDKGTLFWDEPEANLNPKIIKTISRTILQLADSGIQVFIASHSLFLLRELFILQNHEFKHLDTRCFGLHESEAGVAVRQGASMDDVGEIAALDEDLLQSERYMDLPSA